MAGKSWRDYSTDETVKKESSSRKTGSWRDYSTTQSAASKKSSGGWREYSEFDTTSATSNSVANKVNAWLKNHNSYLSDYRSRYSGRKYSYEDSYVNDSENWLNSVTQKMNDLETERQDILSYIDQNRDYLDAKWLDDILNTLAASRESQIQIRNAAYKDNEWWQSFGKDEDLLKKYGSAEEVYKYFQRDSGYREKYGGQTYDELSNIIDTIGDGEEKEWLGSYASRVDYDEKSKFDMDAGTREIESLEAQREALIQELDAADSSIGTANVDRAAMDLVKRIEEIEAQIQKKKAYMDSAKHIQTLNSMSSVTGNKDFADKSKYVSNVEYGLLGKPEFADNTYAYVNNPVVEDKRPFGAGEITARELIGAEKSAYSWDSTLRNRGSSYEREALEQIKPEEVAIYNYYYATQGPEKAREYLDLLVETFRGRQLAETFEKTSQFANKHPILASAMSVGTSLGSGFEYLGDIIEYGGDKIAGKDAQLGRNESSLITNAIRGTVSEKVDWEIGNWDAFDFVYNTVMSGADSLASTAFGGFGGTVLGLSAAAQGTNDALDRGMSNGQAFWNGLVSGVFEGLFESWSIGKFNALKDTPINVGLKNIDRNVIKQITKNIAKSMLVNATEETLTELANITYDTLVNGEFANYTMEDLKNGAWKKALQQVLEAGASGAFMGMGMSTVGNTSALSKGIANANEYASNNYGGSTDALIQEGLESDVKSNSYKLATKYQKQTSKGKELTGHQIRNLVSANEAQFAVEDYNAAVNEAKTRLTELGETKDVDKVAKLVAKRATGQELTRAEKSTLARSQFGAQISKEMTTPTVETENGTKSYNAKYKSLEERINEDEDTNIKEIQTSDDSKAYASEAVAKIENITPAAASAIMHDLDFTKPVGAQLNGIDEAYTYGYHGYSVEDLKAGNFVSNLSAEQMMSAYKLGQSARKISDTDADAPVVKMRTAAEAKLTAEQKTAQQKARIESNDVEVYYISKKDGKSTKFTGKYDPKRMAAVNTAKFLSKLGIGGKYYFYESYVNANNERVYKDANGIEKKAPNGMYMENGDIWIDLNAGNDGEGTALFTLGHELTHFVKAQSKKQFKTLGDLVKEAFDKTDLSMHKRVLAKQTFLESVRMDEDGNKVSVSYDEAYEEVVADAMSTMLTDGSFHEKIMEIKVKDKGLFNTIKRFFDKMIAKFKKVYEELTPDQRDARDIREMKDMFDRIQTAFAEALVEASDNFQALAQAGIAVNEKTDSGSLESVRYVLNDAERKKTAKALAERFKVTEKEAVEWLKAETSLASLILNPKYSPFLDYEADPNEVAIKQNSDYPQGTVDFSNICKKRREFTQVMNRILRNFPNHVFAATDLAKIRTIMGEEGMTLPCGICYVEDRRQLDTIVAQDFIDGLKLYREGSKTRPDGKPFNTNQLKGLQLTDGDTYVPTIYELVSLEGRNSLKAKNPNMEAAWVRYNNARGMQAVRLLTNEAEYKRQILKYSPKTVQSKNDHGGLRIYSFSDAEMFHLIDIIQVITDSAAVGLCIQGYTKVNEYAKAVKDTGEKLNRSLIPKGDLGYHMENGKVVLDYDTVEGIDIYSEDFFDNRDNPDVGNITIGINDVQIRAAMVSDFVDQIIPFHTGQSEEVLGEKGIAAWENYKDYQTEKDIETGRTSSHQVNIYTEVFQAAEKEGKPIRNKRQFVEKFLQVCKENGLQPRFSQFLNVDSNGDYVYTEGYHKLLVDFKTFAQTEVGEYLPQMPVKPFFDNGYITGLLETYVKEQQVKDAEVAEQMPKVIERITNEIVKPMQDGVKNSDRSAKTFKKDQNANGVFVANSLIDLAETDSKWWTGRYNHDILSMSKSDDTEFRQFYQEIEKRTRDMEDYEEQTQSVYENFTVRDGKGKEFIYRVKLDGYMHGVVLEKIDKTRYEAALQRVTKGGANGKSLADIKRRTRTNRPGMGRYRDGDGWDRASDGNPGHGRLGSGSSQSNHAGTNSGGESSDRKVSDVTTGRDFLADDKLKGNYTVSDISEMFDAWNSDPELADLSKKVFAKLQETMDEQEKAYWATPYPIRFKSDAYLQKAYYITPHGVFEPSRTDGYYGITYNLDYFRNTSDQDKARVLLHEAIHACTVGAIKSTERRIPKYADPMEFTPDDSWSDAQKASLELIQVFSQVRVANERNEYGQKNVYEMVAEMSNPEFRSMLKKETLWGRIVDAIKRIFGIEQRTAYDAVSDALERILESTTNDADALRAKSASATRYSERSNAPTFYSHMAKVVDGVKQNKLGAASVVSMLRGKGVKAEEIKWSGIEAWLEGKKSVTKAELQEFIAGSMLQIDEETLSNEEIPYTKDQQKRIDGHTANRDAMAKKLADDWKKITGEEIPITYFGTGIESSVEAKIRDLNLEQKKASFEGRLLEKLRKDLKEVIANNDDFGFDSGREALISIHRHRKSFIDYYELSAADKAVIVKYCNALNAYNELPNRFSDADTDKLRRIAHAVELSNRAIGDVKSEHYAENAKHMTKWGQYKIRGGKNYREILFKMPGSTYYNDAMATHWEERDGVLAHARIQDLDTFLGKMLFIEEIQSDWHNEGHKSGYTSEASEGNDVPDAPFRDTYHEYVLKRLLRMAAEQDYDSIGWTTAEIQVDRWSEEFAEGYRIEYDQDIPKFLNKYGKKWGTKVGKTVLDNGTEVWSMAITDEMKDSVLTEGQPLYSDRDTDSVSNRSLLANAFEGITKSSIEYKLIQQYKSHIAELNELEAKLSDLNAEIRKIRFGTEGAKDTARLTQLESEAKDVAKEINKQDKRLLSLEASEPLRKVIERERKKEAQKTKAHVEEIQQNKKVRAEQAELRHKIRKTIRDLDKILKHGNKQKNVKEDLQPVVTKALKAADILFTENYGTYDMLRNGIGADLSDAEEALVNTCTKMLKDLDKMPTDGYENWQARQEAENRLKTKMSKLKDVFARERKRLNNTTVSSILGELADAYASLEKSEQSYVQGAYTEAVHNFLKNLQSEVGGSIVKDMTKDQLESVYAAYKMVLTAVRKANQMFNEELKQSREQLGNAVIQEVRNAGGVHGLWTKAELAASRADWNNMKPVWVANRIGSETFGKLMNGLFKGQYNFAVDIDEAKRFKLEMDKKYHPRNWDAEKQYKFESSTGKEFSLSLQQIMSVYAFSKREQAYSHLLNGGFVFESNSTVVVDKKGIKRTYLHDGATSYKLNEATLNEIINSLTKEQKAYVDEMQKYLSEVMGEKGNEVSMQLYGIKMFKEQFYFPLRSSGAYMERAKEAEMKKQQGQINLVNSGFTHAVKPEAKNPIILSGFMDVWAEHCNEMSMYHSMVLPMEDFRKVYNYSTVHDDKVDSASVFQTIQDAYGDAATAYIDQLYRELNAGATIDPRETTFKKLISNFKKTAVMLSASVVVQQFSSVGRAYAVIDPKYFIGAKVNSDTNLSVADEMRKYAPVAIIKEMGGFDTGTKGSAKAYIMAEQYGKGERIQGLLKDEQYRSDIMGYLPAKADEKTWCAIWEAVKRETKATHPKMDVKSEEFLKLAGERFSEVIEKTQVYDSVLARSANMRSKTGLMQMATSFMAEPTTTVNLLEDAIRSGNKKHMARAFGAVAVSIVLNNALASVVYAMRDDDEDETFIEKYFQSFTSGMIDDINPMSYYPFLKDVYSLFQGYDVERADMSVIADLRDALKRVVSLMGKDTSSMDDNELAAHHKQVNEVFMGLLDAGCSVFGVPLKNVRRDANGIINAFTTIGKDFSSERNTTWLSFWDKVGAAAKDTIPGLAWTKDKAKTDKLYEAIVSGDKSYLARLKSTYKTDSAYQSAVRKALRENDSRIHNAALAKYEGNAEEYKRIFKEIQKEGKFSFDDIMSAINSEESKIRNGLEPDKATSSYTASDFVEAVAMGNAGEAKAMMEEIISTKVANGKTQEEAEKEFASNVSTSVGEAYSAGLLDEAGAKNMLVDYAGKDEEEAASKVSYWDFSNAHPEYKLSESNVTDYQEFAEPAGIELDVFVQYINGTKNLTTKYDEWGDVEVTKREQVLEVIDSLPLTWQQKDALYLAAGYSESNIWDVPW